MHPGNYPGFWAWWRRQAESRAAGWPGWQAHAGGHCGPCGPRGGQGKAEGGGPQWHGSHGFEDGGAGFGVRRPLRFLAHKLELSDEQVAKLAAILNTLKTERAQSDVDYRRRTAAFADAFEGSSFDEAKVEAASLEQARSAERLRASVKLALQQMHALLNEEQRKKLAYLLRAGVLAI
jgi:Spy/CpxP family protein refolding chaperone